MTIEHSTYSAHKYPHQANQTSMILITMRTSNVCTVVYIILSKKTMTIK